MTCRVCGETALVWVHGGGFLCPVHLFEFDSEGMR